jgi:broad specificity phosphatase PhoE
MSVTTRWWWIRHAPVDSGGRIYGQNDMPADCSDREVFRHLAEALPGDALWVVSHLLRTQQTAAAIRDHLDAATSKAMDDPLVEPAIAEQHFGDWQGLTIEQLNRQRKGAWHRFWLAPAHEAPPGGESFLDLMSRVHGTITRLSREHAGRDIVAVAHGGTIRAAVALALALEPERALALVIDNCSLTRLDHIKGASGSHAPAAEESWRVAQVNVMPRAPR